MIRFMFWMLFASGLGFIKLIALAYILNPNDFGRYISIFGLSALSAAFISFGLLERTIKQYPRQWTEGKQKDILENSRSILKQQLIRYVLLGISASVLSTTGLLPWEINDIVWVCLLGLGTGWLAQFASLYRAAGSRSALQNFSFCRTFLACLFSLLGASLFGMIGTIIGDIFAMALCCIYASINLRKVYMTAAIMPQNSRGENADTVVEIGHGHLYAANMLTSSTSLVDRAWISSALGPAVTGSYGIIMMMPQVFQMLVNIIAQYIGPLIIKFAHIKHKDESGISALKLQSALLFILSIIFVISIYFGKNLPYIDILFIKFSISDISLVLAGIISAGQIYSLIEFHLIAYDKERNVFFASIFSSTTFFGLFGLATFQSLSIEFYIAAAAVALWLQVGILAYFFAQLRKSP
jgi:O-antigen/teichoic acid export membrane protein